MSEQLSEPEPSDAKKFGQGCLMLVVIGAVLALIATVFGSDDAEDSKPTDAGAIDVCHQAVEAQLRAPGTTDFGGETVTHTRHRYIVTGYVDAENAFGAQLRSDWACEATWVSGDEWRPVTAQIAE